MPIILCGDFNCEPKSSTYGLIINHKLNFKSSYFGIIIPSSEPEITTYKKREEVECKTIDYIFVKGFEVNAVLNLPKLKEIEKIGMPSSEYPSDHFSLACKVNFNYNSAI